MLIVGLVVMSCSVVCYVANVILIRNYIERAAPGLMEADSLLPPPGKEEEYLWERTAGTGIVPRWVSVIGLAAIPMFLVGAVLLLLGWLLRST